MFTRFGDWRKVQVLIGKLSKTFKEAQIEALTKVGLFAESRAKKHISSQDLGWKPLKPETKRNKQRDGYSTSILVHTSAYFQSITSWRKGDTVYVGVKKVARGKEGENIANIAKIHEYGAPKNNIPARPLWRPVLKESVQWLNKNSPEKLVIKKLKKYT